MVTNLNQLAGNPTASSKDKAVNPKGILGKDDFMKLLLTELKYQDPTSPMDTEKMLTQTSQLATLESADNTNKAMKALVDQLKAGQNLGVVSAIGKMGSLGSDTILYTKNKPKDFDLYFAHDIQTGTVKILDKKGNLVKTYNLQPQDKGVLSFTWDGTDNEGKQVDSGEYKIVADYSDGASGSYTTSYGSYPITSVKFDNGSALLKLGNYYYPIAKVKEIYE